MTTPISTPTMQAFRMFDWRDGGRLCEVPIPVPGPLRNGSLPYGAMISTTFGGSKSELIELVALASSGRLPIHLNRHRLVEVPQVLRQMRRGEIVGRAVIVPNESSR